MTIISIEFSDMVINQFQANYTKVNSYSIVCLYEQGNFQRINGKHTLKFRPGGRGSNSRNGPGE